MSEVAHHLEGEEVSKEGPGGDYKPDAGPVIDLTELEEGEVVGTVAVHAVVPSSAAMSYYFEVVIGDSGFSTVTCHMLRLEVALGEVEVRPPVVVLVHVEVVVEVEML